MPKEARSALSDSGRDRCHCCSPPDYEIAHMVTVGGHPEDPPGETNVEGIKFLA